jgi:hypothetical protein
MIVYGKTEFSSDYSFIIIVVSNVTFLRNRMCVIRTKISVMRCRGENVSVKEPVTPECLSNLDTNVDL